MLLPRYRIILHFQHILRQPDECKNLWGVLFFFANLPNLCSKSRPSLTCNIKITSRNKNLEIILPKNFTTTQHNKNLFCYDRAGTSVEDWDKTYFIFTAKFHYSLFAARICYAFKIVDKYVSSVIETRIKKFQSGKNGFI
mgnify:CR=1 FL=1